MLRIPLWIGEFNVGISEEATIARINQTELNVFIQKFKEMKVLGWAFWLWSFREHSSTASNYNLIDIKEGNTIVTTKYFDYLKNAILSFEPTNGDDEKIKETREGNRSATSTDTICPTVAITKINGTQLGIDYLSSTPKEPVLVNIGSQCFSDDKKILVQGEAYDLGSGIRNVEIHLDGRPFKPVTQQSKGDWSDWSASVSINDNNTYGINNTLCDGTNHRLAVRITDNAGNVDYNTVYINLVTS
jgi:hypothetical protein